MFNVILGIYSISNLNFFNYDAFKYCIFQGAGTIDIITFELLLSLYPVVLITTYALIRKYYYVCKWSWCFKKFSFTNKSITHGICAFLVICFAKINLQAFIILMPGEISFINDTVSRPYKTLVHLQGDLEYFTEMPHTLYALGAILVIITVIAIPTLILLFHPIMIRIVVYFRWGETRAVLYINKCLMIDRLKPVLDSFQGNYKDNLQFFAGLQIFLYRTLLFLSLLTTVDGNKGMLFSTVYLIAITFIHNLVMPFKQSVDNVVYSMIYTLLLTILITELYILIAEVSERFLEVLIWIQIILFLLPLCCFVLYYAWRLIRAMRKILDKHKDKVIEVSLCIKYQFNIHI